MQIRKFFAVLINLVWSQWSFQGLSNTNEEAKTSFNHVKGNGTTSFDVTGILTGAFLPPPRQKKKKKCCSLLLCSLEVGVKTSYRRRALSRFPCTHCSGRLIEVEMDLRTNSGFFSLWKCKTKKKKKKAECKLQLCCSFRAATALLDVMDYLKITTKF